MFYRSEDPANSVKTLMQGQPDHSQAHETHFTVLEQERTAMADNRRMLRKGLSKNSDTH